MLESKHGVIRSIFSRILNEDESNSTLAALQAVRISNDLYGSDILSSFEMAKGFSRAIFDGTVTTIPSDLVDAKLQLDARGKLTRIIRSKSVSNDIVSVGDLVEVFVKSGHEKCGRWFAPRAILNIDRDAGMVTVAGDYGRIRKASYEDIRPALTEDSLAVMIQESIDILDREMAEMRDNEEL